MSHLSTPARRRRRLILLPTERVTLKFKKGPMSVRGARAPSLSTLFALPKAGITIAKAALGF